MKISVKTIIHNPISFYFILIAFMKPESLDNLNVPEFLSTLWLICSLAASGIIYLMFFVYLFEGKRLNIGDVISFFIFRTLVAIIVGLLIHDISIKTGFSVHIRRLAVIIFIAMGFNEDHDTARNRLFYILALYSIINLITILMFPDGMYVFDDVRNNFFLGYDNGHIVLLLPTLFFANVYYNETGHKVLPIVVWVSVICSVVICKSATTIAGIAFLLFLLILTGFPLLRRYLLNWKIVLIMITVVFFVIIIFRLQERFAGIISILGKDSTFTGRTKLWDIAIESIKEHPFLGIGDNPDINTEVFTHSKQELAYAHNEILDILVRSGIIGLLFYLNVIIRSVSYGKAVRNNKVWLSFVAAFWLMMMFESYSNYTFYYIYFVLLLYPRFEKQKETNTACLVV